MKTIIYVFIFFLLICLSLIIFSTGDGKSPWFGSCKKCIPGTFSENSGSESCVQCAAGTHSSEYGSKTCSNCYNGKFQAMPGQESCADCPGPTTTSDDDKPNINCYTCKPGQIKNGDQCKDVPSGNYIPSANAIYDADINTVQFVACENNNSSPSGSKSKYQCNNCGVNQELNDSNNCQACGEGYERPDWLVLSQYNNKEIPTCASKCTSADFSCGEEGSEEDRGEVQGVEGGCFCKCKEGYYGENCELPLSSSTTIGE